MALLEQSQSIETTTKIITAIYKSVSILASNLKIYKLDPLKKDNKGNIRAYEKYAHRISYLIEENIIYIIRVRHASKEPLTY